MNKKYTIILSFIACLNAICLLILPYLAKYLVDCAEEIIKDSSVGYNDFNKYLILMIIFGAVTIVLRFIYNFTYSHFDLKMQKDLREELYNSLIYKNVNELNKYHRGEIEALFVGDVDNVCEAYLDSIPSIVRSISRAFLAIILLVIIGGAIYFLPVVLIAGIFMTILAKVYSYIMKPKHKEVLALDSKASSFVIETIDEAKLIQSYNAYDNAIAYYKNLNYDAYKKRSNRNKWSYTSSSIMGAMSSVLYVFMISFGAYLISKNKITYGALVALLAILNNIYNPFVMISPLLNRYQRGRASYDRIMEIYNMNEEEDKSLIDNFDSIIIDNVSYSYDGAVNIINNLSFIINKGDIVRISGPSGIGKTTLISLILGFNRPQSGNISFKYLNNLYEASFKTRGLIAYVSQENILFSGSIYDNFKLFSNVSDVSLINDALAKASILDEINELPNGINTILKDKGAGLSIGQIQRIMVAIAIASNKPIIILDEPASALDRDNEVAMMNNLVSLGKTIIYISHKDSLIKDEKNICLVEE